MTNPVLQRIWAAREAIFRECDYDTRKLVRYYMDLQKKRDADNRRKGVKPPAVKKAPPPRPKPKLTPEDRELLERAKEELARECGHDSDALVRFYQDWQKEQEAERRRSCRRVKSEE